MVNIFTVNELVSQRFHSENMKLRVTYVRIFLLSFQYIPNEVSIKPSAKEDDKGNPCFVIDKLVKDMLFGVFNAGHRFTRFF